MLVAKEFLILRGVSSPSSHQLDPERRPARVATILNEVQFEAYGHALIHNKTVFLEDFIHDWNWIEGKFRFFSRAKDGADVLIVYDETEDGRTPFCAECGASASSGCEHQPKT